MKLIKSLTMAGLVSTLSMSAAQAALITGGFTGAWFNPDTNGQGFQLQVLPDGRAVALWFTYDANGNQVWLIGNNDIEGNRLELEMSMPVGARFGADFDPDDVQLQPFGNLTLTFDSCNQGTMSWQSEDPQFGSGSMSIKRLTRSVGVSCSASLADNRSGSDPVLDFRIPLINESAGPGAKGRADYESRPGRVEFEVEVEDIPVGDYPLLVDGFERGTIEVRDTDDGPEGEIEFSSPRDDGDLLLDFEPLGALIEVTNGSSVLFSGILDPEFAPSGDDDDDHDDGSPGFGSFEIEVDFINTALDGDASGDAELEQQASRVEFDVEIEDLDIGTYELWVAGEMRAEIEVIQFDDDTEGEVEFRNPVEPGKLLLDFDPRGQLITIEQAGAVFLTVDFPSEPAASDDDDDEGNRADDDEDDDDSGNDDGSNDDDDGNDDDDDDSDDDEDEDEDQEDDGDDDDDEDDDDDGDDS